MSLTSVTLNAPEGGGDNSPTNTPAEGTPGNQEQRPEWLQDKFATVEEQAKAYVELQKLLGSRQPPPGETLEGGETGTSSEGGQEGAARQAVEQADLDFDALTKEFRENGKLSEESYKALEAKGISRSVVDAYVEGQKALANQLRARVAASVGGEETLNAVLEWAGGVLTEAEIEAYDNVLASGDENAIRLAVMGLHARYAAEHGQEPSLVGGGGNTGGPTVRPFNSNEEIVAAMSDPKYDSDPSYREEVARRLAVSNVFGG